MRTGLSDRYTVRKQWTMEDDYVEGKTCEFDLSICIEEQGNYDEKEFPANLKI